MKRLCRLAVQSSDAQPPQGRVYKNVYDIGQGIYAAQRGRGEQGGGSSVVASAAGYKHDALRYAHAGVNLISVLNR